MCVCVYVCLSVCLLAVLSTASASDDTVLDSCSSQTQLLDHLSAELKVNYQCVTCTLMSLTLALLKKRKTQSYVFFVFFFIFVVVVFSNKTSALSGAHQQVAAECGYTLADQRLAELLLSARHLTDALHRHQLKGRRMSRRLAAHAASSFVQSASSLTPKPQTSLRGLTG